MDNIDQLISNGRMLQRAQQSKSQTLNSQEKIEEYVNPLFLKGSKWPIILAVRKSKVVYARWFDKKVVTS